MVVARARARRAHPASETVVDETAVAVDDLRDGHA
jgi:hypothetical protein